MINFKNGFMFSLLLTTYVAYSLYSDSETCSIKQQDGILVDCSHRGIMSFPTVTSHEMVGINVSFNRLSVLRQQSLSRLTRLRHLDLSHNILSEIDQHAFRGLMDLRTLDLSYNRLTVLSNQTLANLSSLHSLKLDHNQLKTIHNVFQGLTHLFHLDLTQNQLQFLPNDTFSQLHQLRWLGLSTNSLKRLEANAMTGLDNLTYLDLSHNRLELTSSVFPSRVFASLGNLNDLHVEGNDDRLEGEYPDSVFSDLVSLRSLSIDTFDEVTFGQDFAALHNIHSLYLNGNCKLRHLSNSSLEGFKNSTLSFLKFYKCPLLSIEQCALCDLPALTRLWYLQSHYLSPIQAMESLYGLQGQTMSEIKMNGLGYSFPFYYTIDNHNARYLRNICVSAVALDNCHIQRMVGNALVVKRSLFLRCIEHMNLASNSLLGDNSGLIKLLNNSPRLRTLSMQNQQTFSLPGAKCVVTQHFRCIDGFVKDGYRGNPYLVTFPMAPTMTYLNLSSLYPHLNPLPVNLTFISAVQLKTLDMSYLGMANCRTTFYGLQKLETFSLNGNYCYNITETMFDFMHSLKHLFLSNTGIPQDFFQSHGWRLFQNLDCLEILDLSLNNIYFADKAMLRAQQRLREVNFAGNRLRELPVYPDNHANLTLLDLSRNMLLTLTSSERAALDKVAGNNPFSLRLRGNPLECSCFNLDFIQWLGQTAVLLDGDGPKANYTCITETGEVTSTERVMAHWLEHWRRCVGVELFGIALSAFLTQMLGLVLVFIVARSWTQLCYAWKAIRRLRLPRRQDFRRDAYVVYADVNNDVFLACVTLYECLEQEYGVRLLLPDREELPGSVRAESIVQHIDDSWKVLLLVTLDFSRDEWACGFTVQQAQRSITDIMPDRVIIVFFEDPKVLPAMPSLELLLRMVPERNVLYVHRDTPVQHEVWKTLADLITDQQ